MWWPVISLKIIKKSSNFSTNFAKITQPLFKNTYTGQRKSLAPLLCNYFEYWGYRGGGLKLKIGKFPECIIIYRPLSYPFISLDKKIIKCIYYWRKFGNPVLLLFLYYEKKTADCRKLVQQQELHFHNFHNSYTDVKFKVLLIEDLEYKIILFCSYFHSMWIIWC